MCTGMCILPTIEAALQSPPAEQHGFHHHSNERMRVVARARRRRRQMPDIPPRLSSLQATSLLSLAPRAHTAPTEPARANTSNVKRRTLRFIENFSEYSSTPPPPAFLGDGDSSSCMTFGRLSSSLPASTLPSNIALRVHTTPSNPARVESRNVRRSRFIENFPEDSFTPPPAENNSSSSRTFVGSSSSLPANRSTPPRTLAVRAHTSLLQPAQAYWSSLRRRTSRILDNFPENSLTPPHPIFLVEDDSGSTTLIGSSSSMHTGTSLPTSTLNVNNNRGVTNGATALKVYGLRADMNHFTWSRCVTPLVQDGITKSLKRPYDDKKDPQRRKRSPKNLRKRIPLPLLPSTASASMIPSPSPSPQGLDQAVGSSAPRLELPPDLEDPFCTCDELRVQQFGHNLDMMAWG